MLPLATCRPASFGGTGNTCRTARFRQLHCPLSVPLSRSIRSSCCPSVPPHRGRLRRCPMSPCSSARSGPVGGQWVSGGGYGGRSGHWCESMPSQGELGSDRISADSPGPHRRQSSSGVRFSWTGAPGRGSHSSGVPVLSSGSPSWPPGGEYPESIPDSSQRSDGSACRWRSRPGSPGPSRPRTPGRRRFVPGRLPPGHVAIGGEVCEVVIVAGADDDTVASCAT